MVCWILSLKSLDIWNKGKPISFVSESFDSEHFIHCKAMTVRCQLRMEHILSWKSFHFDRTHLKLSVEFQYFISLKGILIIEALNKMDNLFQQFLALGSASKDIPFHSETDWNYHFGTEILFLLFNHPLDFRRIGKYFFECISFAHQSRHNEVRTIWCNSPGSWGGSLIRISELRVRVSLSLPHHCQECH